MLDDVKTSESAAKVDGTEDNGGDVGVADTDGLKDGGSVVEEVVGTCSVNIS